MNKSSTTHPALSFSQIKEDLLNNLEKLLQNEHIRNTSQKIIRLEFPCENINCLQWLNQQSDENKIYWSDRNNKFEIAGLGFADKYSGNETIDFKKLFDLLQQKLTDNQTYLRYYGGISFDNCSQNAEWKSFGSYNFTIPQFEIFKVKTKSFFALNITKNNLNKTAITKYLNQLKKISFSNAAFNEELPKALTFTDTPNKDQWDKTFQHVTRSLASKTYEKIVLAKKTHITCADDVNALTLLSQLKEHTPNCFHYYFQPTAQTAFLGASPEQLFKRQGLKIESEAIAGTRPRGKTKEEDALFKDQLLNSNKDALEHKIVIDMILNTLNNFCSSLQSHNEFSILRISSLHHLMTRINGDLKKNTETSQILSSLHPTPAVGGFPTKEALAAIRELEHFDRGWYTGSIGFLGHDHAEFAVAIRCALVKGKNIDLYTGAGIVDGSTTEDEWNEIENKNNIFYKIFNKK